MRSLVTSLFLQWIIFSCKFAAATNYNMQELCAVQRPIHILLHEGSHVQLHLAVDRVHGTNCEINLRTMTRGDALLLYFENFDFAGSNSATVLSRHPSEDCGTTRLKVSWGADPYMSTCMGARLARAPPISIFSPLGSARLNLSSIMAINWTSSQQGNHQGLKDSLLESSQAPSNNQIKLRVTAMAAKKATEAKECPSGCCDAPYIYRCPSLGHCIDKKLACHEVIKACGPVTTDSDKDNVLDCNDSEKLPENGTSELKQAGGVQRIIADGVDADMNAVVVDIGSPDVGLNMGDTLLWSHAMDAPLDPNSDIIHLKNEQARQVFDTGVEAACGIVSIALFCLAGVAVFACRSHGHGHHESISDGGNYAEEIDAPQTETDTSQTNEVACNAISIVGVRPKAQGSLAALDVVFVDSARIDSNSRSEDHLPPTYESLYPK